MDAAAWAAIVGPITTLLGGLGGYWLAGRNEDARDRRAAEREAAARRAALAERLEEDRHTFQRDTLLGLQDELGRYVRITTRIILQDEKALRESGRFCQLPPEMNDEESQIRVSVMRLWSRILDQELRQTIGAFLDACAGYASIRGITGKPEAEALAELDRRLEEVSDRYSAVTELLGQHLRRELDRRFLATEPAQNVESPGGEP